MNSTTSLALVLSYTFALGVISMAVVWGLEVAAAAGHSFAGTLGAMLIILAGVAAGCFMAAYANRKAGVSA